MPQNKGINDKLDELSGNDVLLGWNKENAWLQLDANMEAPGKKRIIPYWLYGAVAAVFIGIVMMAFYPDHSTEITETRVVKSVSIMPLKTENIAPVAVPVKSVIATNIPAKRVVQKVTILQKIDTMIATNAAPIIAPAILKKETIVKLDTPVKPKKTIVVYNLTELMNQPEIPLMQQKRFVGIFKMPIYNNAEINNRNTREMDPDMLSN